MSFAAEKAELDVLHDDAFAAEAREMSARIRNILQAFMLDAESAAKRAALELAEIGALDQWIDRGGRPLRLTKDEAAAMYGAETATIATDALGTFYSPDAKRWMEAG